MQVSTVAGVGGDLWRERHDEPVASSDRSHRLAHHHRGVGSGDRIAWCDRHLELTVGVFGMELLQITDPAPATS